MRAFLARLNQDDTLDLSFKVDQHEYLGRLIPQEDGKILAAPAVRFNSDGTRDLTFVPRLADCSPVWSVVPQPDGKVLIGASPWCPSGLPVFRLNADGSRDSTFSSPFGPQIDVLGVLLQPDGKVLIGFDDYEAPETPGIARLNADGSIDATFRPGTGVGNIFGDHGDVRCLALQPNGDILIAGRFTSFDGAARWRVARIFGDRPELSITRTGPNLLRLSWPAISSPLKLQEFRSDASVWADFLHVTTNSIDLPIDSGGRLYRLNQ